ncbi:hypothetical protein OSC27_04140 [Microbacterium sp. STN6]|uniref:hypothetical protein n=1 Tax=Microbacterium sp. STN6 TaxID=2995588 RepID=UPI002260F9F5|nr:hypothetical protein [Microbacterium sp. STN6]MCX7521467.1 hypothetical protein [Microbacterium sp. STN6]
MFEYEGMTGSERVQALQARITQMQRRTLDERALPTLPPLAELLPGGAMRAGSAYSVIESHALVMAMLAGPSEAGSWCGVVGVPDFGVEAAAGFGIDLQRLVLVPNPGDQWLTVTAALVDVLPVVVTQPRGRVNEADAARLAARLRQRGATLIAVGPWPQSEARLSVETGSWSGIGAGFGRLRQRSVTVTVASGADTGRRRRGRLWLPGGNAGLEAAPRLVAVDRPEGALPWDASGSTDEPLLRTVV